MARRLADTTVRRRSRGDCQAAVLSRSGNMLLEKRSGRKAHTCYGTLRRSPSRPYRSLGKPHDPNNNRNRFLFEGSSCGLNPHPGRTRSAAQAPHGTGNRRGCGHRSPSWRASRKRPSERGGRVGPPAPCLGAHSGHAGGSCLRPRDTAYHFCKDGRSESTLNRNATSPKGAPKKSSKRNAFPMAPFFAESRGGFVRSVEPPRVEAENMPLSTRQRAGFDIGSAASSAPQKRIQERS